MKSSLVLQACVIAALVAFANAGAVIFSVMKNAPMGLNQGDPCPAGTNPLAAPYTIGLAASMPTDVCFTTTGGAFFQKGACVKTVNPNTGAITVQYQLQMYRDPMCSVRQVSGAGYVYPPLVLAGVDGQCYMGLVNGSVTNQFVYANCDASTTMPPIAAGLGVWVMLQQPRGPTGADPADVTCAPLNPFLTQQALFLPNLAAPATNTCDPNAQGITGIQATCNADHSATVMGCSGGQPIKVTIPATMNGLACSMFNDIVQIFPTSKNAAVHVNC